MGRERWLLTGATGRLGGALRRHWQLAGISPEISCIGTRRAGPERWLGAVDLTDPEMLRTLLARVRPTRIFHCAGIARPVAAQEAPLVAARLHVAATRIMADAMRATGGWLLHCSTDFVFDGEAAGPRTEDDEALPRSYYGFTKLAGEHALLAREAGLAVRLSALFDTDPGAANGSGWDMMLARLYADEPVHGIVDEWRTPVHTIDAAAWLTRLALDDRHGLLHVGGAEVLSPFTLLERVAREIGSRSPILPITRADLCAAVERPRNVALDTARLRRWLGHEAVPMNLAA